jgi:hypothetical protein
VKKKFDGNKTKFREHTITWVSEIAVDDGGCSWGPSMAEYLTPLVLSYKVQTFTSVG